MGIKTVPHPPYSPDLAPCDFCLFPKLRGCHYETIEKMSEAVMKVIDTLTQVLASSLGISTWTPLILQHSNPNPNPLAYQLWCIDFLTPPTPLIIPHRFVECSSSLALNPNPNPLANQLWCMTLNHRLHAFLESLMPLKNWCSIHARWSKSNLKHSIRFCGIFSKFKTEF